MRLPLLTQQWHTAREEGIIIVPEDQPSPLELPYERISLQPFEAADRIVGGLSAWTQREYFWAPGGGAGVADGYVDELLAQVTRYGRLLYCLIDANYSVVAVCRDPNDPNASSQPIAEQYVWSPYGEPLAVEVLDPAAGGSGQPAGNRIGHQGLPFHRLDGGPADPPLVAGEPLTGTGYGLYFNRARWYEPSTGRFLQADLNETALPLITALVTSGESAAALALSMFSAAGHYADGMNLYAYLSSNPINGTDPLGLSEWDDEIDDLIDELTGHKLCALGTINEGARWAAIGLNTALDIAGSLLGLDVFASVTVLASGQGGFWDAMNVMAGMAPGSGPLRAIGKMAKFRRGAKAASSALDLLANLSKWRRGYNLSLLAEATAKYPKLAGKKHMDHVVPNYVNNGAFNIKSPLIKVDGAYHQLITNGFRKRWPYGKGPPERIEELEDLLNEVYAAIPLPID